VTVGTDHHPFARVLGWVASWPGAADGATDVFAQHGTAPLPAGLDGAASLAVGELQARLADADAVVSHGGPATILEARHAGRLPIVVPRRGDRGEHVDDHQVRFATWMAERGQVVLAPSEAELHAALDRAAADPDAFAVAGGEGRRAEVSATLGDLVDALVKRRG